MIETKITGLEEELAKISSLGRTFDKHVMQEMDKHGLAWRDDVRKNTPVVTGDMRRSTIFEGVEKIGMLFISRLSNNLDYVEHVELGHRQNVGQFVPALGKRLVARYVPGQYIFRNARRRALKKMPDVLKKAVRGAEDELNSR